MSRTVYNTATSLDGFIATEDHSLEWLFSADGDDALGEVEDFIRNAGAILCGASTYEWILRHEGDKPWPYGTPTWVLTHRDLPRVEGDVRFAGADTDQELRDLHAEMVETADGRDVWLVGGGGIAADLARLGLLDEVVVSIAPATLGSGAPLLAGRVDLRVLDVHRAGDFACARYEVVRR
ncbi:MULTISPECIES: dihydrofolate reductase family protein [Nocardiopsis]|uniref:Deaminase n=1 Tax=Nocardiopsis sinuspersici TaxID=501010 RepID=A0A1V3BXQ5_9ACTN|nr:MULTISPECIES: dihydrofolate reductase family protein [Nocardiopsis]NYH54447.1 dihydrofolate reductase [Nocardiopsis sinuspersici]OOC53235.1 deaminase [Nocardiopsis sinuspersici]